MTRKKITFWLYNQIDIEFLDKLPNVSDFLRDLLVKVRTGKISAFTEDDLKRRKLLADIEYKEILTAIKKREFEFHENFGKTPSYQASKAIKVAVNNESFIPPEEKSLEEIIKINWEKFILSLRTNSKNEWIANCKLCDTGFILPTKELAINRFKNHLSENHNEELLKI